MDSVGQYLSDHGWGVDLMADRKPIPRVVCTIDHAMCVVDVVVAWFVDRVLIYVPLAVPGIFAICVAIMDMIIVASTIAGDTIQILNGGEPLTPYDVLALVTASCVINMIAVVLVRCGWEISIDELYGDDVRERCRKHREGKV
jgi:hypothetical protein